MTISRAPWSSSWAPEPAPGMRNVPARRGVAPRTSTASTVSPVIVKMVEPSVLTLSGSSTPGSWTFVVENVDDPLLGLSGDAVACGDTFPDGGAGDGAWSGRTVGSATPLVCLK